MKHVKQLLSALLVLAVVLSLLPAGVLKASAAEAPAALDIGYPTFKNTELLDEVYDLSKLGVSYSEKDIMMAIYKQDLANGGDSFYMDRILAREGVCNGNAGSNGNADGNTFLTRGRALYMYTSSPSVIGFGGNTAYHQPLGRGDLVRVLFSNADGSLTTKEDTSKRVNAPSNWSSTYSVGSNLTLDVVKFIHQENVAVTTMTLTNKSAEDQAITVAADSTFATEPGKVTVNGAEQTELTGTCSSPAGLTTIYARMTGDGFEAASSDDYCWLSRDVTVPAGGSVELKVVIAFTTEEIPESTEQYLRFAGLGNLEAVRAQKAEYNLYWAENLPYIDVPKKAVQKAIDYRWWLERFNSLDANIPGYDYQYPVTIEGVLGYNNAIILTQPMHLQDTKWLRSPYLAYGQLLSAGNSSQSSAFLDNPGNRNNWNNHYGQYLAEAGYEAFNVIGGGAEVAENFAYYFGHDATGQLEHYGNHIEGRDLIAYRNNYMTGNDADTISMHAPGTGTWKAHGENAYVWAAADAAAKLYEQLGNTEQAKYYRDLADKIKADVLELMWCEECQKFETYAVRPTGTQHNANQPNLVKYTESNNYNYFAVGLVPDDAASVTKYKEALKAFSNGKEFPIFPFYTANQVHNQEVSGSNNFSNINFTVQLRLYESALRTYDKEQTYITDDMLAMMAEWMAWNVYPDAGDVRYPNNNEFHNIDGRTYENYYRSWIYHNILGNYTYLFIEDMAGIQPRSDEKIELSPIDFSYDHFMVNNARYHGHDLTVVWDKPDDGKTWYNECPEGYSLYIDGTLAFTLKDLAHVVYDSATKEISFPDGAVEIVTNNGGAAIPTAMNTAITEEKVLNMLEKSGVHGMTNLAEGAEVTATFTPDKARAASWAEKHRADGSDSTSKAVNETAPDPQAVVDGTTVDMPFWGNYGSVNERDSLTLKLSSKQTVDMATLYFYNDRQTNGYSEPSKFTVEYWDGEAWQAVRQQTRNPSAPRANYNAVYFAPVETDQLRFTFTNKDKGFTAVTEIQLFNEGGDRDHPAQNTAPSVKLAEDTSLTGNLYTTLKATCTDDGMPYDKDMSYAWEVISAPEGAETLLSSANKPTTTISGTVEGEYTVRFTVSDGELSASGELTVTLKKGAAGGLGEDVAPDAASVESDYTSSWENLNGINNPSFEPTSSNMGTGKGWGNWSQSVGSEHYVGYTWDEAVTVGGADIYWYDDGGGLQVPSALRMQYLDANGAWQDVNITTPFESSIAKNKYNRIEFDRVTTTRLRLYVTVRSGAAGNGIYRFKVYSSVDVASLNEVFLATKPGVMPTLPSNVTAVTSDGALISVPVTWETLTADMIATDGEVKLRGVNNSTGKMTTCTIYVRSDMDKATITSVEPVEVTTTQGIVPALPKTVKVGYNNGAFDNQTVKVTWPAITAAELANVGDVNFEGEVEGTATKAMLTIHVLKAPDDPAVAAVKELIDAIGEVTLESGDAIDAARTAYDKLPEAKKALVDNYEKLTAAEAAYEKLLNMPTYTQVTDLSTLEANAKYLVVAWRYFGGTEADSTNGYVFQAENNGDVRAATADTYKTVTGDFTDNCYWTLTYVDGKLTMQNAGTGKYLGEAIPAASDEPYSLTVASGEVNGCANFAIGTESKSIRFSGSSNKFSFGGGTPASQVTGTNACNLTIYKVVDPNETEGHTIIAMSDYQNSHITSEEKKAVPTAIAKAMKKAGVRPERAVLAGDYVDGSVYEDGSDTSLAEMMTELNNLKGTLTASWKDLQFLAIQGNHDNSKFIADGTLNKTGAYEYDGYIVYLINEDDFPWWQAGYSSYSDGAECKAAVEKTASDLEKYLTARIEAGDTRPVLIVTHVPMHWSPRSTTGQGWWNDNIYADILFDVVNRAGESLDIVFLFGHNHSSYNGTTNGTVYAGYDQDIGGALAYVGKGETMRVPNGTTGTTNYTEQTLSFTYMNAGYVGNYNGSQDGCSIGAVTVTDNEIRIDRYNTAGLIENASHVIERGKFQPVLRVESVDGRTDVRTVGETEAFRATVSHVTDAVYAWSCDESIATISGADTANATLTYAGAGDLTLTCKVTYQDEAGESQTLTATFTLKVESAEKPESNLEQVTDLSKLESDAKYLIVAWRYFGGTEADSTNGYVFQAENNGNVRAATADGYKTVTGEFTDNCYWTLTYVDGKLTMQNVGTGKYLSDSIPASSDTPYSLTVASGEVSGYPNFAIGTESSSIRYSGTSGTFSFGGGTPASQVTGTNACNLTIYKLVEKQDPQPGEDTAAEIAKKAAEEAKQAQEEAEAAQKAAEEAVEAAKAAQEAAEAAAAKAGENNAAAEEARKAAETAQAAAEAAQAKAEEAQKKAEEAKTGAEAARKAAEENNAAAAAEAAKAVSEALKAAEEAGRSAQSATQAAQSAAQAAESMRKAQEAQAAAEAAQAAAEAAQAKAEEAQKKAEEAAASSAEDKAAAEKAAEEAKAAKKAAEDAKAAAEDARAAAELALEAAKKSEVEAAASAAEAAEYARQMAETYQKVVEIKAELINYLAEAQAAAEKAEAERKAAEEARKAAEEAALAASKYTATFELAQLLHESETLTGHAREDYAKVIEDAKAAIEAAKTPEEVDEILAAAREALKTAGCPSTNFTDVEENGWYHTGVDFMVKNGFMNGVADDAFDVDGNLTRAQLVTILYRIAGEPESTATNPFADVADGQWYTNAVIWAAENGIVKGVNTTTFAPNDQITREQIATILFRYAKAEKVEGKLAGFPDAEKVSDYAADAMAWAVEQGLINGISESDGKTYLAPQETATRAQIAVILMRYLTAEN